MSKRRNKSTENNCKVQKRLAFITWEPHDKASWKQQTNFENWGIMSNTLCALLVWDFPGINKPEKTQNLCESLRPIWRMVFMLAMNNIRGSLRTWKIKNKESDTRDSIFLKLAFLRKDVEVVDKSSRTRDWHVSIRNGYLEKYRETKQIIFVLRRLNRFLYKIFYVN